MWHGDPRHRYSLGSPPSEIGARVANFLGQIDPNGCGCTECLVGEYKPLEAASYEEVFAMLTGKLSNATGEPFRVEYIRKIVITGEYSGLTWTDEERSETRVEKPR